MNLFKASVIHDTTKLVQYNDQTVSKLNQNGKQGIGCMQSEKSKPTWIKNRLDKDKEKFSSQSYDLYQQRRTSTKVSTGMLLKKSVESEQCVIQTYDR
ncbi:hypothetical protein F511_18443 [Dorcoceras hygrometricum]|uniref:Uncharacterized protein n=1 Tax=Dorcoceras hygrometricum TaxID=472368 RepID=A0A2Z7B555_9LAMI|nr:hypothetical protein F511_18443 [Dorcoceras hygrometricum]